MKGDISKDMLIKIGLMVMAAGVVLLVVTPLIQSAGANVEQCGAMKSWLSDLSAGGVDLC